MSDLNQDKNDEIRNAAADLIRKKMSNIYVDEPGYDQEVKEVESSNKQLSKHQQYIEDLHSSGKPSSEIQVLWHQYYESLPDNEKHEVWNEFYKSSGQGSDFFEKVSKRVQDARGQATDHGTGTSKVLVAEHVLKHSPKKIRRQSGRRSVIGSVSQTAQSIKRSKHLKSLGFGLVAGIISVLIFLFGFFNQVFIVPFVQPSRNAVSTPIILSTDGLSNVNNPEIIIPKLNLEIPVNYTESSSSEAVIENDLNSGIVHYPTTVLPGQNGNTAYFGHSSNNIFNPGKYKFAFVLLHTLVPGDTFYLVYNSKAYVYQVFSKQIVPPSQVSVLNPIAGHAATATLITCDPPGTSINRLVVVGDQISPSIASNSTTAPAAPTSAAPSPSLPGNGPSLWSRLTHWL